MPGPTMARSTTQTSIPFLFDVDVLRKEWKPKPVSNSSQGSRRSRKQPSFVASLFTRISARKWALAHELWLLLDDQPAIAYKAGDEDWQHVRVASIVDLQVAKELRHPRVFVKYHAAPGMHPARTLCIPALHEPDLFKRALLELIHTANNTGPAKAERSSDGALHQESAVQEATLGPLTRYQYVTRSTRDSVSPSNSTTTSTDGTAPQQSSMYPQPPSARAPAAALHSPQVQPLQHATQAVMHAAHHRPSPAQAAQNSTTQPHYIHPPAAHQAPASYAQAPAPSRDLATAARDPRPSAGGLYDNPLFANGAEVLVLPAPRADSKHTRGPTTDPRASREHLKRLAGMLPAQPIDSEPGGPVKAAPTVATACTAGTAQAAKQAQHPTQIAQHALAAEAPPGVHRQAGAAHGAFDPETVHLPRPQAAATVPSRPAVGPVHTPQQAGQAARPHQPAPAPHVQAVVVVSKGGTSPLDSPKAPQSSQLPISRHYSAQHHFPATAVPRPESGAVAAEGRHREYDDGQAVGPERGAAPDAQAAQRAAPVPVGGPRRQRVRMA